MIQASWDYPVVVSYYYVCSWHSHCLQMLVLWHHVLYHLTQMAVNDILVPFCNIALMPPFSLLTTSIVTHPTPVHRHAFPHFFVVVFVLISLDVDLTLFVTFITTCKTSSIKIWFVLPAGLAENLTQVAFRQPFVIQHVITRLLSCETWNFLFFIFFHHYIIN